MFKRVSDVVCTRAVRWKLRRLGVDLGPGATFIGRPAVRRADGATIRIGERFTAVSSSRRQILGLSHEVVIRAAATGASIVIGDDCGVSGATIVAYQSITIGDRCLLGADVLVVDSDFHTLAAAGRRYAPTPEGRAEHRVVIEDDVFVGARATILKGVSIGAGSVVGAGAVVTRSVPAGTVVAGNPAVPIRMVPT